ncbi:hypothetical protein MTO96_035941 [Rhipicephalus appendiculatus]
MAFTFFFRRPSRGAQKRADRATAKWSSEVVQAGVRIDSSDRPTSEITQLAYTARGAKKTTCFLRSLLAHGSEGAQFRPRAVAVVGRRGSSTRQRPICHRDRGATGAASAAIHYSVRR